MSGKIIERVRARQKVAAANRLEELRQRNVEAVEAAFRRHHEKAQNAYPNMYGTCIVPIDPDYDHDPPPFWRRLWPW